MKQKFITFCLLPLLCIATPAFAAMTVSIDSLVSFVIYMIVVGLIFYLLWWLIAFCGIPEPFSKMAKVIIAIVAVLICVNLLLGLVGVPPMIRLR